jgi:hypothetical protein
MWGTGYACERRRMDTKLWQDNITMDLKETGRR